MAGSQAYPPGKWRGAAGCLGTLRIRRRMKRRRSITPELVAAEETHGRENRPIYGMVAQQADAIASKAMYCEFKSHPCHHGAWEPLLLSRMAARKDAHCPCPRYRVSDMCSVVRVRKPTGSTPAAQGATSYLTDFICRVHVAEVDGAAADNAPKAWRVVPASRPQPH